MTQSELDAVWPGWTLVRKLGQGSYGGVFEIQRELPGGNLERSAFKKISIPRSQDEADLLLAKSISEQSITAHYQKQMEKLVQEYVMMRQLDTCPNIVTCQDLSYVPNGYGWDIYFRMELLHPLKQVIQNSYEETDVIQLGIDICSALIACESVKIIHRDIKPDNIMVSSDGTFKLGDFGIAKTSEKTQTGTMAGTYNYMAPEVANRKRYGLAADIYSLGMVLYWMMNNKTMPFLPLPPQIPSASQKQQALNRRFSGEQLPEPQNGSRELKEIVAKACAYAPEDRYHSALEMRNALEALSSSKQAWTKAILEELALPEDILHESNRPIAQRAAAEEKPPKSDIPPAKRKPIVPLVVCGILGICILAGGLLWRNRKHASPEPAAMTEALQEQTETAAEPEETTAPGSTTEETLPAATEAESTAAVLLSNVDCTYEIAEDGITITGISGQTPSEVILPEELENLPVTRIGNGAFQSNTSLKKVTLPSGILVIGEKAFSGCTRLQSISFPDGLTEISASAFENCSNLSSVLLPESVHAIGPWAFSNCKKLLSITIPGSASDLGEWAFSGCSSLSELTFSPGITTISNYLFYNCQGLKAVTIPDGVITIGIGAFSGCTALSEVTLPESMRTLSSEAFQGTALESISVPSACSLGSNAVPLGCKIYSTR